MESLALEDVFPEWSNTGLLVRGAGLLLPVLIPYVHIGIIHQYWTPYKRPVDRDDCSCTCWDTVFKGSYQEWPPTYKHLYFNVTWNSLVMWTLTVVAVAAVYEVGRHLTGLWLASRLRPMLAALLLSSLYPHYYTWWSYLNSFNDDFYQQFLHQGAFSLTEVLSSVVVLYMVDIHHRVRPRPLLFVLGVALLHVLVGATDQFVANVVKGEGEWHQWTRDLGFMTVDVLHIIIPLYELVRHARNQGHKFSHLFSTSDCLYFTFAVAASWLIMRVLP